MSAHLRSARRDSGPRVLVRILIALAVLVGATVTAVVPAHADTTRDAIVAKARSQVGVTGDANKCQPYGPCVDWCALFAEWVWRNSGVTPVFDTAVARGVGKWGVDNGLFKARPAGQMGSPLPGDVVVYGSPADVEGGHVSIVSAVHGSTIDTIDGNYNNAVHERFGLNPVTARAGEQNLLISGYVTPRNIAPPYVSHPGAYVNGGIDDLSGDGHADLLFVDRSNNTVGYIPNNSNSNPNGVPFVGTSETKVVGMAANSLVAAADISGDSYSDLLIYDPGQDKVFYYANYGIAFTQGVQTVVGLRGLDGTAVTKILAADLTSDGHADFVFTTAAGNMYYIPNNIDVNAGHVPYAGSAILAVTGLPSTGNVALGYVTGDRFADLMFVANNDLYFMPNNILVNPGGVPFAGAATVINAGTFGGVVRFTAADVNGDNRADILWQDSNGTVYNLPNNTQLTEPYYTTTSTAVTLPIPNGTLI